MRTRERTMSSRETSAVKTSFFLVFALALIPPFNSQAWSQSDKQKESEMVVAAEREWAKAAVDRDITTFAKYMSDDYVLIAVDVRPNKQPRFDITTKSSWVDKVRLGREH